MSTYDVHLPNAFPYYLECFVEEAAEIVSQLIKSREHISNGSSFAVTSDTNHVDVRRVWLSKVSLDSLYLRYRTMARYSNHRVSGG